MPSFTDSRGVEIATYEWLVETPKAVVQISHGLGEHAQRYAPLAADLNRAGYSVVADDHRGHGETGRRQWVADPARMGRLGPGGLRATVEAIHDFSLMTRDRFPELPLVLLGHSWGSLMAQISLNRHSGDYDGVVLSGSAYRAVGWMDAGDLNRRHKHLGASGAEWLSRDPEVATRWLADPLTFPAETRALFGTADALRLLGRPARNLADVPLLLQVGSDDTLGGARSVQRLAAEYRRRSGLSDVRVHVYPGARHEVYNETNRDAVIADLVGWLDGRVVRTDA